MTVTSAKFRIYPTEAQKVLMSKTFGCVRWVYNYALAAKMKVYETTQETLSVYAISAELSKLKDAPETEWLREVNSQALQMSLRNLDAAYSRFFREKKGFPRFKSRYDRQSFCNPQSTELDYAAGRVYIPKFKGGIKARLHRKVDGRVKSSTVSRDASGRYFISVVIERDGEHPVPPTPIPERTLGIDLGLKTFATFSNGDVVRNPRHLKQKLKSLKRAQRKLSRRTKGSKNRDKARKRVAKIHARVSDSRRDFLHKVSCAVAKNQGYTAVAIEDLAVCNMAKNHRLARHIMDAGWRTFRDFLAYKCEREGKTLLTIGRFEPSSKLCTCGVLNNTLTLRDRVWTCSSCNTTHDRDALAAQNIVRFAFCKQDTSNKISASAQAAAKIPLERRKSKPVERPSRVAVKQEAVSL